MSIKTCIGIAIIIISLIFSCWLAIGFMLVGGINSAIEGFTTGNISQGVWGIVRALFSEVGFIPFYLGWLLGLEVIVDDNI